MDEEDLRKMTYKDIEDTVWHLFQTGRMSIVQYLDGGWYQLPNKFAIVSEKDLETLENLIREDF